MAIMTSTFLIATNPSTTNSQVNMINILNPVRFKIPNGKDVLIKKINLSAVRTNSSSTSETGSGFSWFSAVLEIRSIENGFIGNPPIDSLGDLGVAINSFGPSNNLLVAMNHLNQCIDFGDGVKAGLIRFNQLGYAVAGATATNQVFFYLTVQYEMSC
jgi:hypothetical protein